MIEVAVAFGIAKAAVAGVKEAIALGHEIQDCYRDIASFFDAQGEIEAAVAEQKITKAAPEKSSTAEALDAVFAARQMKKLEQELKEMLIYNSGNESGLYDEMCQRRSEIIQARKDAIEDAARAERLRLAAIARKKRERIEKIQMWLTVVVGTTMSAAIIYAIWWMFNWKDH
jgi:rubrerythrin